MFSFTFFLTVKDVSIGDNLRRETTFEDVTEVEIIIEKVRFNKAVP